MDRRDSRFNEWQRLSPLDSSFEFGLQELLQLHNLSLAKMRPLRPELLKSLMLCSGEIDIAAIVGPDNNRRNYVVAKLR